LEEGERCFVNGKTPLQGLKRWGFSVWVGIVGLTVLNITPAIKHVNKFCAMPVVIENGDHAFIYLFAGVIIYVYPVQYKTDLRKMCIGGLKIVGDRKGERKNGCDGCDYEPEKYQKI
jgi:hypothetical protein